MLRIRASEKRSLEDAEREAFIQHVYDILAKAWHAAVVDFGEDNVKGVLRAWLPLLLEAGIATEKLVAKAMNVFFAMVVDFDVDPLSVEWVRTTIDDPEMTGLAKVYSLEVRLFRIYEDGPRAREASNG
jgi:hypothetical protein